MMAVFIVLLLFLMGFSVVKLLLQYNEKQTLKRRHERLTEFLEAEPIRQKEMVFNLWKVNEVKDSQSADKLLFNFVSDYYDTWNEINDLYSEYKVLLVLENEYSKTK